MTNSPTPKMRAKAGRKPIPNPKVKKTISLTTEDEIYLRNLGGGVLSVGVGLAAQSHRQLTTKAPS